MASARIDLINGGVCAVRGYRMDTTIPAAVRGAIAPWEWQGFCEQVEQTVKPLQHLQIVIFSVLTVYIITFFSLFASARLATQVSSTLLPVQFHVLIVLFALLCVIAIGAHCYEGVITERLAKVCEQYSRPDRSFHVRRESIHRQLIPSIYFEVSVASTAVTPLNPDVAFDQHNADASAAHRLQQLDGMRYLLTPNEYDKKRAEILELV